MKHKAHIVLYGFDAVMEYEVHMPVPSTWDDPGEPGGIVVTSLKIGDLEMDDMFVSAEEWKTLHRLAEEAWDAECEP